MAIKDLAFPSAEELRTTCKRNKLIPQPNGYFLYLRCKACDVIIVAYSHSQTKRTCPGCDQTMLMPRGGKARIEGNVKIKKIKKMVE